MLYKFDQGKNLLMSSSRIDTLISGCKNWDEFFKLAQAQSKVDKGDLFERLTQLYLLTHPNYVSKLKHVWWLKHDQLPSGLLEKLKFPIQDEGVDLICQTLDGKYWSVQCKFRSAQQTALTTKELAKFTSLSFVTSDKISFGLIVHTSHRKIKKSGLLGNVSELGAEYWASIDVAQWSQILNICRGNQLKPPKPFSPFDHQKLAIKEVVTHFCDTSGSRGKLIMPCASGKSLTAFWIAKELNASSMIIAVPSLALLKQSLSDWTREFLANGIIPDWIAICSDETVGELKNEDSTVATTYELGIETTTSETEIRKFLEKITKSPKVIFTTYQSAAALCDAAKAASFTFDLLIADEAHKTAGRNDKIFSALLFEENITVSKRLFMTATERVYRGKEDDVVAMNNEEIYGRTVHSLSFKKAIEGDVISDYQIVTMLVQDREVQDIMQSKSFTRAISGNVSVTARSDLIASALAIEKTFAQKGVKHTVSFHRSITNAKSFKNVVENLAEKYSGLSDVEAFTISGTDSAGKRKQLLQEFIDKPRSLISNARCLTEGVDVPSIDCVLFAEPKRSVVDIVQAAGRALRKSKESGKTQGLIVVPIVVPESMSLEDFAQTSRFKDVVKIISALSTQDERIAEELRSVSEGKSPGKRTVVVNTTLLKTVSADLDKFANNISIQIWSKVAKIHWRPFEQAREYVHALGLSGQNEYRIWSKTDQRPADIPSNPQAVYPNFSGFADWLGTNNKAPGEYDWRPFEKAVLFAQSLKLKSVAEWRAYVKSPGLPDDIPTTPYSIYEEWTNWSFFLGSKNLASGSIEYWDYVTAEKYVRKQGFTKGKQLKAHLKNNPDVLIPARYATFYIGKGWVDVGTFLGTGFVATFARTYLPFDKARELIHRQCILRKDDYGTFDKNNGPLIGFPQQPQKVYKDSGWKNWSDWLGYADPSQPNFLAWRKQNRNKDFCDFEEAREFGRAQGFKTAKEWQAFAVSGKRPKHIAGNPDRVYQYEGWAGWVDFLGTKSLPRNIEWMTYEDAVAFIHPIKITSFSKWRDFCKSELRPQNCPSRPDKVYDGKGWVNWAEWFGPEYKKAKQNHD